MRGGDEDGSAAQLSSEQDAGKLLWTRQLWHEARAIKPFNLFSDSSSLRLLIRMKWRICKAVWLQASNLPSSNLVQWCCVRTIIPGLLDGSVGELRTRCACVNRSVIQRFVCFCISVFIVISSSKSLWRVRVLVLFWKKIVLFWHSKKAVCDVSD